LDSRNVEQNSPAQRRTKPYHFVLSFAGEDRPYVTQVYEFMRFFDVRVFYDEREQPALIGEHLYEYFADMYENRGMYCVMFISKHYVRKHWPRHERRFAQARAFRSRTPYILPVRLDSTTCPGVPLTIGYIDGKRLSPSEVALLLVQKLGHHLYDGDADEFLLERFMRWRVTWAGTVHAWGKSLYVHLGDKPKNSLKFNIWSCDDRPLNLTHLEAYDRKGSLRTKVVGKTLRRKEWSLFFRTAIQFGQQIEFRRRFTCQNYYADLTEMCKDTFRASVPIREWQYEFVFPKNSELVEFEALRIVGKESFRATFSTSVRNNCPVVHFSFQRPRVGSVLSIAFQLQRKNMTPIR
jgi:hypothetical protein